MIGASPATANMHLILTTESDSIESTLQAGRQIARLLLLGDVVCLSGELGAGKTTLMKGLVSELSGIELEEVTSPTFTYLHMYSGLIPLYHFDLYRLKNEQDFLDRGFEEYMNKKSICCIEWPERISQILPKKRVHVTLEYQNNYSRKISVLRFL